MKAVITGGGTGGHIYPALAAADELKKRGWKIIYIGSEDRMESEIVPRTGYQFRGLKVRPLPRSISLNLISFIYYNFTAFLKSLYIINDFKADIVLGTGGYTAAPAVLAGKVLGKKTFIHEQNAYPGITNKILAKFVDLIMLNFSEAEKYINKKDDLKIYKTGNPVRKSIINVDKEEALKKLSLDNKLKTILITGGSQGSEIINSNLVSLYKYAAHNEVQIIHLTGKKNYQKVLNRLKSAGLKESRSVKIIDYLDEMEYALSAADLIISRAGATAISEIAVCGLPSILIPFASAAENHQLYNAQTLAAQDAAVIIEEKDLNEKYLLQKAEEIIADNKRLQKMSEAASEMAVENAAEVMVDIIENYCDLL